jgi:hypothetical protein
MTPLERKRFGRQIRLAEVGEAGQSRLCRAAVALGGTDFVREIEGRYLCAAGVSIEKQATGNRQQATGNGESPLALPVACCLLPVACSLGIAHPIAAGAAEGALRALITIRSILESE